MLTFDWNTLYEATPGDGLSRGSIDDTERQMSRGIRERMEREHNFGYNTELDDGTHRPGLTTVALMDDAATMAALTDMQDGAVYVQDDGTDIKVHVYNGATWTDFTKDDHGSLEGLSDDDHEDYWLLTENLDASDETLNMGSNHLDVTGTVTGGLKVSDHITDLHDITAATAVKAADLPSTVLKSDPYNIQDRTFSGVLTGTGAGKTQICTIGNDCIAVIGVTLRLTSGGASDGDILLGCIAGVSAGQNANFAVRNDTLLAKSFIMHVYYIRPE